MKYHGQERDESSLYRDWVTGLEEMDTLHFLGLNTVGEMGLPMGQILESHQIRECSILPEASGKTHF